MSLAESYSAGRHFYARPPLVHTLSPSSSLGPSETGSLGKVLVSPKSKDFAGCWGRSKLSFGSGVFLETDSSTLPSATSQELSSALRLLVSAYTHQLPAPSPDHCFLFPKTKSKRFRD